MEAIVDELALDGQTYHTTVKVRRIGIGIWLAIDGGADTHAWAQFAFGVLSPAKARALAAMLLIESARAEGQLDGAY